MAYSIIPIIHMPADHRMVRQFIPGRRCRVRGPRRKRPLQDTEPIVSCHLPRIVMPCLAAQSPVMLKQIRNPPDSSDLRAREHPMKIGLDIISAALERMLRKHQSAASAALPLETVVRHWESTRLRASDLVLGIEALHRQGRINLEPRHDGLWLRHRGGSPQASSNNPYERLRESVQQLTLHIALSRVEKRQDDGYSGLDRRLSQQAS